MWGYDSAWMWLLMVILWVGLGVSIVVGLRISRATFRPSARVRGGRRSAGAGSELDARESRPSGKPVVRRRRAWGERPVSARPAVITRSDDRQAGVLYSVDIPLTRLSGMPVDPDLATALNELDGVESAVVNAAGKRARVDYDRERVTLTELLAVFREHGVRPEAIEARVPIKGLHGASVRRIERELANLPGVLEASVSLSDAAAKVTYQPGEVRLPSLGDPLERSGDEAGALGAEGPGAGTDTGVGDAERRLPSQNPDGHAAMGAMGHRG